jgi:hypothetical protein
MVLAIIKKNGLLRAPHGIFAAVMMWKEAGVARRRDKGSSKGLRR